LPKNTTLSTIARIKGGVFQVFANKGVVEFKPTEKGLHVLNLQTNPDAAFLLVNDSELYDPVPPAQDNDPPTDEHLHVNTVHANYEGFTKQQVKNAERAHRLMGMVATPSERDFQGMVHHNLLKDCPVTNEDIHNAHATFGPDLARIRGKMVCRKPERVVTDYVKIPRDFFH
jgi:hypothetical protein